MRAVAALILLSACLPKESLTRRDEVGAELYDVSVRSDVTTTGLDVPPFAWELNAKVGWSYTRTFRDGSLGHLVEVLDARAGLVGGVAAPVLERAILELRTFPDGRLLKVAGATPWVGDGAHIEQLECLWFALSPHIPGPRAASPFLSSWPIWAFEGMRSHAGLTATWTASSDDRWSYSGNFERSGGYVTNRSVVSGAIELGAGDLRVAGASWAARGDIETKWPAATVQQSITTNLTLQHAGRGAAPALDMPPVGGDMAADARTLTLKDGRAAADVDVSARAKTPFLFLPDDLPEEQRGAARASLFVAGSIP